MHARNLSRSLLLLVAATTSTSYAGCTLVTATSGYESRAPLILCGDDGAVRDLRVDLTGFSAHLQHVVRGDVVHIVPGSPMPQRILVGRFVLDPGGVADPVIVMPCLLDGGDQYEVDLAVDVPDALGTPNRMLDCPPLPEAPPECHDHQWRLEVQADGTLDYVHDLLFENISDDAATTGTNMPMDVTVINATAFAGLPLEVQVRRLEAVAGGETVRRTVYLHRLGMIPATDSFSLPAADSFADDLLLAESGATYEIALWVDSNGNRAYEPPSFNGAGTNRDVSFATEANTDVGGLHPMFDAEGAEADDIGI